jgi:RNA polymerase sigma-70 factor, ECF subfamily
MEKRNPTATSDEDIVQAVLAGSKDSFGILIERYQRILYAIACSRLRDPRQAREVVHDAFVQAYLSLPALRKGNSFGPWIRTILYNACLKNLGRHHREIPLEEGLVDIQESPQIRLEEQQAGKDLSHALDELTPLNRETVILFYFFDFSIEEMARFLNIPPGTVKRRLHDSRTKLKDGFSTPPFTFDIQLEKEILMEIREKNIPGSELNYLDMSESTFRHVDLSRADFDYININGAQFRNTGGANGTPASDVTFDHCTMQKSHFNHVDMSDSHFHHVNFTNAKLEGCAIDGLVIDGVDIKALIGSVKGGE